MTFSELNIFKTSNVKRNILICIALSIVVVALYWQVKDFKFIYYDDSEYVTTKSYVMAGLTWDGFKWAISATESGFWHPVTWLSLMLDRELFGYNPGGFHWTNVILHLINTLLLFFLLKAATNAPLRSAFVALLFAIHPLHIESVACVSQRKDLLCTLFGFAALWAYVRYASLPNWKRYIIMLIFFVLGLMSKPMIITFPFVMLLMDYWPLKRISCFHGSSSEEAYLLHRFSEKRFLILLAEKLPLILLSVMASILVIYTEKKVGALTSLEALGIPLRFANAVVSYVKYIWMMLYPSNLAFLYPYPVTIPKVQVIGALLLIMLLTFIVVLACRRKPYLFTGWFWYLGTLFPVSGIVQVGPHALADRYTYVPIIGLFIMFVWLMTDWAEKGSSKRILLGVTGIALVIYLFSFAWFQIGYWRNSITLFQRALDVTSGNYIAMNNLGYVYINSGENDKAILYLKEAIKAKPNYGLMYHNMGVALYCMGSNEKAIEYLIKAQEMLFRSGETYRYLGDAYRKVGKNKKAIVAYKSALSINSGNLNVEYSLAMMMHEMGENDEAIQRLMNILSYNSSDMKVRKALMAILLEMRNFKAVTAEGEKALAVDPDDPEIYHMMGSAYKKTGELSKSKLYFNSALNLERKK